MTMSVPDEVY